MRIYLEFGPEATQALRARLTYAFRLFCAVYGHDPLLERRQKGEADVSIHYGAAMAPGVRDCRLILNHLAAGRLPQDPAPPPSRYSKHGESTVLFYQPRPGHQPDWLGEIFEWVSCADEYSVEKRDMIGRVPFCATYAGRHHLDIRIPYAAVAMRFLERELSRVSGQPAGTPRSPIGSARHLTVVTHDVDYLPTGRWNAVWRLAKNAGISLLSKRLLASLGQARMTLEAAARGRDSLDQISALALVEKLKGIGASYYLLPRQTHRRDANYSCNKPDPLKWMNILEGTGFEVGVHGTYTSVDHPDNLAREYEIERQLGFEPIGGRQHWLRFTLDRLIPAIERAGASYDTSLGWADRIGFRAGACFAFPPYNFAEERPAKFLEIPLVIMDQGLQAETNGTPEDYYRQANAMLSASREYGWGGVSLLWHPTAFGGGWLPREIGAAFWKLADERAQEEDLWLSGRAFRNAVRRRYEDVGLLPTDRGFALDIDVLGKPVGFPLPVALTTGPAQRTPALAQGSG